MSISNLFNQNDYSLFCSTISCRSLSCDNINSNKAIYRLNIDSTSNPDPNIGGLIVTSASTTGYDFVVPLTNNQQQIGLANTINYDPQNHLTFSNNSITCNKTGNYNISIQLNVLSNLVTANNIIVSQIVNVNENLFGGPPGVSASGGFIPFTVTPISPLFNIGSLLSGSANIHLNQGDNFNLKFFLAYDSCVIALTSNVSIIEL